MRIGEFAAGIYTDAERNSDAGAAMSWLLHRFRHTAMALLVALAGTGCARAAELTVSAAASLTQAFQALAPLFEAANPGHKVLLNFGASNALLQQIAKGAPVDVFASADQETMDQAQAQGLVLAAARRNVVSNSLVVVVPAAGAQAPRLLADLTQATYARIAVGLPTVPVGRYTRGALEAAGLWATIEPKVIGAQNVRQALDYVARGEVDAGFVYATDAALLPGKVRVAFTVATRAPVLYPAAPVAASSNAALAARFVAFLGSAPAQAVFARHGFGKP
jgi:molybdate transport system substrate-binding protein